MKLKLIPVVLLCISVIFISCSSTDRDYLSFIKYPMTVKGRLQTSSLECGLTLQMNKGYAEINFDSPESLEGFTFVLDPESEKVFYEDTQISFSDEETCSGIFLVFKMFSLDAKALSDIGTKDIGGKEHLSLTYPSDDGSITLYKKRNESIPVLITAESKGREVSLVIESIKY